MHRLETLSTRLDNLVGKLDETESRRAAVAAARFAVNRVQLAEPAIDRMLQAIEHGVPPDSDRSAIESLVGQLDQQAWDIQDRDDDGRADGSDYLTAFARARAASSVLCALGSDPLSAARDAIYEASFSTEALDDLTDAIGLGTGFSN